MANGNITKLQQPHILLMTADSGNDGESAGRFTNTFQYGVTGCRGVVVSNISFFNLIYPFKTSNRTFIVDVEGDTTYTINISDSIKWSSGSDFATYLTTLIQLQTAEVEVTYDSDSAKLTFQRTGVTNFRLSFEGTSSSPYLSASKLGFYGVDVSAYGTSFTGNDPLNLAGPSYLTMELDIIKNAAQTPMRGSIEEVPPGASEEGRDFGGSLVQIIPIDGSFGSLISITLTEIEASVDAETSFSTLRATFRDDDGELILDRLPLASKMAIGLRMLY